MTKAISQTPADTSEILSSLLEARSRTLNLVGDLDEQQLMGPRLSIVNPLKWEIGHIAYFQEYWCLRQFRGEPPVRSDGDQLYDSARIAHDTRWDLPLPSLRETFSFMQRTLERVLELNQSSTNSELQGYGQNYFLELSLFHEQMHAEAIAYTRQTLSYRAPNFPGEGMSLSLRDDVPPLTGDAFIPGGRLVVGNSGEARFAFDNERKPHQVEVAPFSISRTAVTQSEFAAFVDDRGYTKPEFWSEAGWLWKQSVNAEHPVYWRRGQDGSWFRRLFDQWIRLEDRVAVIHINWYEADAYCRWAGRRLPTESEWEMAASSEPLDSGGIGDNRRIYPWGDDRRTWDRANLDFRALGCIGVDELPMSDSAFGVRQMIGNSWEWTSTDFGPYPGFRPGPYKEYSEPWFGNHKVLRGGCWATRSELISNTYRNFYTPDRRDVWAGFRTCAF